jgi:hypothetical protein
MFEGELDEALSRPRYVRRGKAANADGAPFLPETSGKPLPDLQFVPSRLS